MRHNPAYAVEDERVVRRLIEENPWATIVSQGAEMARALGGPSDES